jgi:hypothetical protein
MYEVMENVGGQDRIFKLLWRIDGDMSNIDSSLVGFLASYGRVAGCGHHRYE